MAFAVVLVTVEVLYDLEITVILWASAQSESVAVVVEILGRFHVALRICELSEVEPSKVVAMKYRWWASWWSESDSFSWSDSWTESRSWAASLSESYSRARSTMAGAAS